MSYTHTVTESLTTGAGISQTSQSFTVQAELNIAITVGATSTNEHHLIAFPASTSGKLKTLYIVSDQNLTMYTNAPSGGSPADTVSLVAGVPLMWNANSDYTDLLAAADVTSLYFTNAGSTLANVTIKAGWNT